MKFKFNKSSGQASRLLLVLAVIVLVAVIITFLVMRMAQQPSRPVQTSEPTPEQPTYERKLGDIRFVFQSSIDKGNVLSASKVVNTQYAYATLKDLTTTEKFIQVTVGAQNKGTVNIESGAWDLGDIIDSEGRKFIALDGYTISPWLPAVNLCKALLKPAFNPTPCTKIYEVSGESTNLKVEVKTGTDNSPDNFSSGKFDSALINLIVK